MASTSTLSIQKSFKYDVFLSFRGEDTRKSFVDHLYHALQRKNIITYRDNEEIKKGIRIGDDLMRSIEDSKFYIIVFSKNYASSSWCLDELVKIMECQKTDEHTAYPVFYDVEPTEVRKQSGVVGAAFAKHEKKEVAGKWRVALREAADLVGWELKNTFDGHEAKFIQKIVERISLDLSFNHLRIDEKLVGMEARIKHVVSSLEIDTDDIRMIGIKGMGGAGKTTLAKAVFDHISFCYECSSFVENVRENSRNPLCGLKLLQKQILLDVLNDPNITVNGVSDLKNVIKKRMCGIKVLVVLDDVDHIDQLEALVGELNRFKPGSRVIITTREEQVLVAHGVPKNLILNVSLLSSKEANCLFNRHAFRGVKPNQAYKTLSDQVVLYAAGLPLTIKVLGSFLCGKDELEWIDALERLKAIPLKETLEILELSYHSLEDDYKEIFLDVACILKGWDKEEAIIALESCRFHARIGLRVLEQKSLISWRLDYLKEEFDFYSVRVLTDILYIHDHIEEMGQNIVRRFQPHEPYKHSRLWVKKEIHDILVEDKGTDATRCIEVRNVGPLVVMKGLRKMKELRFLDVICQRKAGCATYLDDVDLDYNDFGEENQYLLNGLQYLRWDGYPFKCLPKNFQATNLVRLKMAFSNIGQLWEGGEKKVLKKLRFIELRFCKVRSLDITLFPNLERLILVDCKNMVELRMPARSFKLRYLYLIGSELRTLDLECAQNLETLEVRRCYCLTEFRMPVESLKLKHLSLRCSNLRSVNLTLAKNLETLHIEVNDALVKLHFPIESLKLKHLTLKCFKLKTVNLSRSQNLETLIIKDNDDLTNLHFPNENLKCLKLQRCKIKTLNLTHTRNLQALELLKCEELLELHMPGENPELKTIKISYSKLISLNLSGTRNLESLDIEQCKDLVELRMPDESLSLKSTHISCLKLKTLKLGLSPHLLRLDLHDCFILEEVSAPVGCLSGRVRFRPFWFNQHFSMVGSLADLYLRARRLGKCPLHPDNNLPKFYFEYTYKELLPSSTQNLQKLISFGFCGCTNLASLSSIICALVGLKRFTLEGSIPKVPKEIEQLECLEKLTLLSTNIEHLPDSICNLKHLKVLELKSCSFLKQLPEDLGNLECLEKLSLSITKIEHLPDSVCMLKHLQFLMLESCWFLKKLPGDLGRLESLEELRLTDCKSLRDIPNSICDMKRLKCFHLTKCSLVEKLPKEIGRLQSLDIFYIQGTGIIYPPESIFELKGLRFYP